MLFRSKKTRKSSPQRSAIRGNRAFRRGCRLEALEERRMLSAFNLADYGDPVIDTQIADVACCLAVREYSGITYSDETDQIFIVDDETESIIRYDVDGSDASRYTITTDNFDDLEGIVHMYGTTFALLEERDQGSNVYHLSIVEILDNTTNIDKLALATDKVLKMSDTLLDTGDSNEELEGVAYDRATGVFYIAKELNRLQVFEVTDLGGGNTTLQLIQIDNVTNITPPDYLKTISDIFFTDKAGDNKDDARLFMMSSHTDTRKVIMADQVGETDEFAVVKVDSVPVEVDLETLKWEGLTFTPGGFLMFAVADEINGDASSRWRFRQYRNFKSLTPDAAPDLDAASDTGLDDDNITTALTPSFSGTLTRGIFEDSVPVKDAWVWLYVDGVPTGSPVQVDVDDSSYTLTAGTLNVGDNQTFTIKAGEDQNTLEADRSFASAGLDVNIVVSTSSADLNGDSAVDFQDLTILLANFNKNVSAGQGNIVEPATTPVNFDDLTVLLAA